MDDCKIIKMDPESPEWKARMEKLHEKLLDKYNGEEHEETSYKYNKFAK